MRRKVLVIVAAAVAGMLLLTACTSSENNDMKEAGAGASADTASGTGSQTSDTVSKDSSAGEADDEAGGTQPGQSVAGIPVEGGTSVSDNVSGGANTQGGTSSAGSQKPANGTVSGEFDGVYQNGDGDDETEQVTGDIWTGTYGNEQESLTITYVDSKTISFTFAEAGIYGKAEVKGYQAVYKGDDYHNVVFNIHGDIVDVSVSSEEDYDTSGSPLIGSYIKDYIRGAAEEDADDAVDGDEDTDDNINDDNDDDDDFDDDLNE